MTFSVQTACLAQDITIDACCIGIEQKVNGVDALCITRALERLSADKLEEILTALTNNRNPDNKALVLAKAKFPTHFNAFMKKKMAIEVLTDTKIGAITSSVKLALYTEFMDTEGTMSWVGLDKKIRTIIKDLAKAEGRVEGRAEADAEMEV